MHLQEKLLPGYEDLVGGDEEGVCGPVVVQRFQKPYRASVEDAHVLSALECIHGLWS